MKSASLLLLATVASAAVVEYDWDIGYVQASPDGFERRVIGVNGQFPPAPIEANIGDNLVVTARNNLDPNAVTSLHAHGFYQNGTTYYDGPIDVTQCAIPYGESLVYNYTLTQSGTYWIHSHFKGQYPDGLRTALIIKDPFDPNADLYDEDITLTVSDWYHAEFAVLVSQEFMNIKNPGGAEPVPDNALINDAQDSVVRFEAGKRYRIRIINMSAFAAFFVWIEDHPMRVIEVDGVAHEASDETDGILITAAQRYSVIVEAKNDTSKNFAIVGSMDTDMFDAIPDGLNPNVTAQLVYNDANEVVEAAEVDEFPNFNDTDLVPIIPLTLRDPVQTIQLDVFFNTRADGLNYANFNNRTYREPRVPTLFTALSAGELATNETIYGFGPHPYVLPHNDVIEIILNNYDPGKHPFHLHGHHFQVVYKSDAEAGPYDPANPLFDEPENPMRRDTVQVPPNGHAVLRFRSDNPGIWLFHCHIEWHVISGLTTTFVEAPIQIQEQQTVPQVMIDQCNQLNVKTEGNVVGNTENFLDLTGEAPPTKFLAAGFTTKGVVALVFSVIAAFLGMAVISWYGLSAPPTTSK